MAKVHFEGGAGHLTAYLAGEIDHHGAALLRAEIDARTAACGAEWLVLDFGGVSFMDSSGVGLILGRQRRMEMSGGVLWVQNPPENVKKMLKIARVPYREKEKV